MSRRAQDCPSRDRAVLLLVALFIGAIAVGVYAGRRSRTENFPANRWTAAHAVNLYLKTVSGDVLLGAGKNIFVLRPPIGEKPHLSVGYKFKNGQCNSRDVAGRAGFWADHCTGIDMGRVSTPSIRKFEIDRKITAAPFVASMGYEFARWRIAGISPNGNNHEALESIRIGSSWNKAKADRWGNIGALCRYKGLIRSNTRFARLSQGVLLCDCLFLHFTYRIAGLLLRDFLSPVCGPCHPVDITYSAPHLIGGLLTTSLHLGESTAHYDQLEASNTGVNHCRKSNDCSADNISLRVSRTLSESQQPTLSFAHRLLLILTGIVLAAIAIFSALCIFVFHGPSHDAIISVILLAIGCMLFCWGIK